MENDYKQYATGWMSDNLRKYQNTLVPDQLIKDYGIQTIQNLLTLAAGKQVSVKKGLSDCYVAWIK